MKRLTNDDVKDAAQELISQNGQTTTLEVKQKLRNSGFFALQDEVSSAMATLGFNYTENGIFRTYTDQPVAHVSVNVTRTTSGRMSAKVSKGQKTSFVQNAGGTYTYTKRDGKAIDTFDTSNGATRKAWSPVHGAEYFFGPGCTRSEARYIYSKITGVKYSKTRVQTLV